MVLNLKEWETVGSITAILLKYRNLFNDREKKAFLDFYGLTIEATKKQDEARRKSAERIKEKRAINKNYARGKSGRIQADGVRSVGENPKKEG